jgi:hypothetical protein
VNAEVRLRAVQLQRPELVVSHRAADLGDNADKLGSAWAPTAEPAG